MAVSSLFLSGSLFLSFFSNTVVAASSKYSLDKEYSGANFFDGFTFFTEPDPTHGFVDYVDYQTAYDNGLIAIGGDGTAYLGVDSTTVINPNGGVGRQSVRVQTKEAFTQGLFILDASNMPGGVCGTWPAWWSYGPGWPAGGAIDIIEGVNSKSTNLISLQTAPNCSTAGTFETGTLENTNCDVAATYGVGCGVSATTPNTYGLDFNAHDGGVYATEWTDEYIRVWFFPRGAIPSDITSGTPDPSTWGAPTTNFQGACDIDSHFFEHNFVLNTDFCGEWAGSVWGSDSKCAALAPTCEDFVGLNPEAFEEMYWAINYIKVFKKPAPTSSSSSSSLVSSTTTSSSSSSTSSVAASTTSSSSSLSSSSSSASATSSAVVSSSSSSTVASSAESSASSTSTDVSSSSTPATSSSSASHEPAPSSSSSSDVSSPSSTVSSSIFSTISYPTISLPSASPYPSSTSLPASTSTSTPCSSAVITTSSLSTVYKTSIYTTLGQLTTEVVSLYTTICPVTLTSTYSATTPTPYSTNAPIRTSIPSYTTVVTTTYTAICPEGTLKAYTTSQTQVIYRPISSIYGVSVQTSAGISMVTQTTVFGSGEVVTLTVPYSYPSTTAAGGESVTGMGGNVGGYGTASASVQVGSSAKAYGYAGNSTATAAAVGTGKATLYTVSYPSASSSPIVASSGAGELRVGGGLLAVVIGVVGGSLL